MSEQEKFPAVTHYTHVEVQPGGINIQSVQNLYQADVLKGLGIELEVKKKGEQTDLPTREEMQQAVMKTYRQGYWWGKRSWAVVYRVYQMRGYMNSIAQFVREVEEWDIKIGYECNYDAIQKPIAKGVLSGTPDKWIEQGAQSQAVKLAEVLAEELDKSSRISIRLLKTRYDSRKCT